MFYTTKDNELIIYDDNRAKLETTKSFMPHLEEQMIRETDIVTSGELQEHPNKVIIENDVLVLNPDYEQEEQQKEQERISHLKCTKRVFVLMLEQLGLDYYEQIEPKINANRQAKLEWDLCVELERSNPLLDLVGEELGVTHEQLNKLFQYANGEITEEEFRGTNE